MSVPNPTKSIGNATGSPAMKVLLWLFVIAGILQTAQQWWNGEQWFLLDVLDYLWGWALKISEAIRT
jgi:hypothetical protein